jgi:hypothetical protein
VRKFLGFAVLIVVGIAMMNAGKNDKPATVPSAVAAVEPEPEPKPPASKPAADSSLPPAVGTTVSITEGTAGC